jgi:hypothetical protein
MGSSVGIMMGGMIETEGRDERNGETECNDTGRYRTAAVNIHINGLMSIMEEAAPRGTTTRLSIAGRVLGARLGLIKHMSRELALYTQEHCVTACFVALAFYLGVKALYGTNKEDGSTTLAFEVLDVTFQYYSKVGLIRK